MSMEHYAAFLPPPGLPPPSTEHDPNTNPPVSQNYSTSVTVNHQRSLLYSHGNQHQIEEAKGNAQPHGSLGDISQDRGSPAASERLGSYQPGKLYRNSPGQPTDLSLSYRPGFMLDATKQALTHAEHAQPSMDHVPHENVPTTLGETAHPSSIDVSHENVPTSHSQPSHPLIDISREHVPTTIGQHTHISMDVSRENVPTSLGQRTHPSVGVSCDSVLTTHAEHAHPSMVVSHDNVPTTHGQHPHPPIIQHSYQTTTANLSEINKGSLNPYQPTDLSLGYRSEFGPDAAKQASNHGHQQETPGEMSRPFHPENHGMYQARELPESWRASSSSPSQPTDLSHGHLEPSVLRRDPPSDISSELQEDMHGNHQQKSARDERQIDAMSHQGNHSGQGIEAVDDGGVRSPYAQRARVVHGEVNPERLRDEHPDRMKEVLDERARQIHNKMLRDMHEERERYVHGALMRESHPEAVRELLDERAREIHNNLLREMHGERERYAHGAVMRDVQPQQLRDVHSEGGRDNHPDHLRDDNPERLRGVLDQRANEVHGDIMRGMHGGVDRYAHGAFMREVHPEQLREGVRDDQPQAQREVHGHNERTREIHAAGVRDDQREGMEEIKHKVIRDVQSGHEPTQQGQYVNPADDPADEDEEEEESESSSSDDESEVQGGTEKDSARSPGYDREQQAKIPYATAWEQIVDVAVSRRAEVIVSGETSKLPAMGAEAIPIGLEKTQNQEMHDDISEHDTAKIVLVDCQKEHSSNLNGSSKDENISDRSEVDQGLKTVDDDFAISINESKMSGSSGRTTNSDGSGMEREDMSEVDINVTVNQKWKQAMERVGFGERHSEFAEFLLNFYNLSENLGKKPATAATKEARVREAGPVTSKEVQTDCTCECVCHNDIPTRTRSRKGRRPSRQTRSSMEEVFVVAGIEDGNSSAATTDDKTGSTKITSGNRRKGGQRTPRKRKLEEAHLPYSPVPIYNKTKANEPVYTTDAGAVTKFKQEEQEVGIVSFSEESSFESGVDADDHDSDVDFLPPGQQSDSADDEKPLKPPRRNKLRTRSSSGAFNTKNNIETEYVLDNQNQRAPLKIKFKQSRKLNEAKKETSPSPSSTTRTRKPRKPAIPKKAMSVRAKRQPKPKVVKEPGAPPAKRGRKPGRKPKVKEAKVVKRRTSKPIMKIAWPDLVKQYLCKICQYEGPCITDMSLHLLDNHMEAVQELAEIFSKLEVTCSNRTATVFEFLTGRKYEDKPSREELPEQQKRLPPVSGILSGFLSTQEAENRLPPTSEILMSALSQSITPATNAMAFLHGAPPGAVFGALSASGTLPYLSGLSHHALGEGGLPPFHGTGYPPNISRGQDGTPLMASNIDTTVSMLNAAVTSQASSANQASSETDGASSSSEQKAENTEVAVGQLNMTPNQNDLRGFFFNRFRKSGVDIEELSKAIDVDPVVVIFEKWVKIRTQCPHCRRNIRVSKRTNMHRCKGSEDKPVYVLCDVCGNSYQKEYFSLHYNRIHLQSLVSCQICNKKFTPSSLPKHLFKHTNPPASFKCGTCPKSFRFRMDLERHELVHRVDKPYTCSTCGRGFTQKSNMQYHMRQHTGEQPYKCDNCMKSFTHNVSLKNHLKKHHGIDLWAMGYTGGGRPKKEQGGPPLGGGGIPTL